MADVIQFWKCKCLHTGPGNTGMNYEMGGTILSKTVKEKDLDKCLVFLLTCIHIGYWNFFSLVGIEKTLGNFFY